MWLWGIFLHSSMNVKFKGARKQKTSLMLLVVLQDTIKDLPALLIFKRF